MILTPQQVARNTILNAGSLFSNVVTAVALSVIMARNLGPSGMGLYSYVAWIIGLLTVLATLGLPDTITKYVSELRERGHLASARAITVRTIRLVLVLSLVVVIAAVALSFATGFPLPALHLVPWLLLTIPLALQQALSAVLMGLHRYGTLAMASLGSGCTQIVFVLAAVRFQGGVVAMLFALLAGVSVGAMVMLLSVSRAMRPVQTTAPISEATERAVRRSRRFAISLGYIVFLDLIVWQRSEVLFLQHFSPLAEVAIYSIAFVLASRLGGVVEPFAAILMPLSSAAYGRSGYRELAGIYTRSVTYLQIVIAPTCMLAVVLARPFILLLYGTRYVSIVPVFQVLVFALAVTAVAAPANGILYALEEYRFLVRYETVIAIAILLLDIILIPRYGSLGAAVANSAAQIAAVVLTQVYVTRLIRCTYPWKVTIEIYGSALLAAALVALAVSLDAGLAVLVVVAACGIALYAALLVFRFRLLADYELQLLKGLFSRASAGTYPIDSGPQGSPLTARPLDNVIGE
ncbi:MAG: oligosaccharide flippase family protein [Acidobacteriota bacterium]|nr:oligosaccharide flippase family protein [Acidobacteriota bacterium]